jgi:quinol monooxygenase YgiN
MREGGPLFQETPCQRVEETLSHICAFSLGALRVSGGLLEFVWDTDHQTLKEALDEAVSRALPYLGKLLEEGGTSMFARFVECQSKAGRREQVSNSLKNDVLPVLEKQSGFIDFLTLSDKTEPERLVCITFWTSRQDAEEYHRQYYDTITDMLKPLLESPPTLETFMVNASTAHRIAVDRAA